MIKEKISIETMQQALRYIEEYKSNDALTHKEKMNGWDLIHKIRDELYDSTSQQGKELKKLFDSIYAKGEPDCIDIKNFYEIISKYVKNNEIREIMYDIVTIIKK